MAAKTNSKTKKLTQHDVLGFYMDYVLEHEQHPKSVYKFAKDHKFKEQEFYQFYGSIEALKKDIWNQLYHNASQLLEHNEEVEGYSSREKMLTFFYTLFEIFTANRSYILYVLDEHEDHMKNLKQLKGLRKHIKEFASELIEDDNDEKANKILQKNTKLYSEGAWIQFLFLLKFWRDDNSANFEKTDVAIEKSVNTIFDVFDNTPLDKVFDFGKFIYKEVVKA